MSAIQVEIRSGAYYDSAILMQLQRGLLTLPGVRDAGAVMGTPANLELLDQSGLLIEKAKQAGANDLLIVVKGDTEAQAVEALQQVDVLLSKRHSTIAEEFRPKSLETAAQQLPEAQWVLVSVPGRYAAGVARDALNLNKHVFLYSDNVSLEDEVALKQTAQQKGLLVMGPDCGTAIINGVGLGFANHVRRGGIGVVGASGTGTQAVTVQIHNLGGGMSHAIGTGGRDLKSEVGAITMSMGLDALARDPETKVIVLVSKPPAAQVVTQLLSQVRSINKPVVVNFIGYPPPARQMENLHFATSLSEAAEIAKREMENWRTLRVQSPNSLTLNRYLRGLFSGGTLAYETMLGLQGVLSPLYSNSPISNSQILADPLKSQSHCIVDLGDEVFMVGRLHPMIDNDLRLRRLRQEAADSEVGLILMDVVLGEGSHPDPASELAPVIQELRSKRPDLEFVMMVIGTDADPQNLESQIERLSAAGAVVYRTATDAIAHVAARFRQPVSLAGQPVNLETLTQPLAAINVGLESFYTSLIGQGAKAVHVDWRPPAGGNEKLAGILARMKKK